MSTNLQAAAKRYADASRAKSTRAAYGTRMTAFVAFCKERNEPSVPADPETVRLYVADMAEAGFSVSTINQFLSAVGEAHEAKGHSSPRFHPSVQQVWRGVKRTKKVRAIGMKPLLADHIRKMLDATPEGGCLIDDRDRAIISFGWACAHRRHEVADTLAEHLTFHEHGFTVVLPSSKTDQEGKGFEKMVLFGENEPYCPVRILKHWLDVSSITSGHVFRPVNRWNRIVVYGDRIGLWPQYIDKVCKKLMRRAGLDPQGYGAHSLRAGFVTQAALMGKTESEIMRHTGHGSFTMVRRYIRVAELHKFNATRGIGL